MKYVLFIKESCPFCVKAKEVLEQSGAELKIVNFEEDQVGILQEIKEAYNWPTVPMIFEAGEKINFIGGYTDLVKHFDEE